MKYFSKSFLLAIWDLTKGFWQSEEKWKAYGMAAVIIAMQVIYVGSMVYYNSWQKDFYNTIQAVDQDAFFYYLKFWPMYMVFFIFIEVNRDYLMQWLEIKWRTWLVHHYVGRWLGDKTYYLLQIAKSDENSAVDNPDQRISDDIRLFVNYMLTLTLGILNAVMKLISFSTVLWGLSGIMTFTVLNHDVQVPGYMLFLAIVYALTGCIFTIVVGKPIVKLNYKQQEYEANFRFGLARIREYCESIASFKGEITESLDAMKRFFVVRDNFKRIMTRQWWLSWVTSLHWRIGFLFPYLVGVPRVFSGDMQFGGLMQTAVAFQHVENALAYLVLHYYSSTEASFAQLQAVVQRLSDFKQGMADVETSLHNAQLEYVESTNNSIGAKGLTLYKPDGREMISNLTFTINKGESLMISGPSGRGKSTLLKALTGIWPYGKGTIEGPAGDKRIFLPQKAYMPMGTLRDIIVYPSSGVDISDHQIIDMLRLCQLEHLVDRIDEVANWGQLLSLGEQQRVSFARLFLLKPEWVFLDESTSALDVDNEALMYELLKTLCPQSTVVSVAHRLYLRKYHDKELVL